MARFRVVSPNLTANGDSWAEGGVGSPWWGKPSLVLSSRDHLSAQPKDRARCCCSHAAPCSMTSHLSTPSLCTPSLCLSNCTRLCKMSTECQLQHCLAHGVWKQAEAVGIPQVSVSTSHVYAHLLEKQRNDQMLQAGSAV